MIARCENTLARDFQQTRQFTQRCSFVVIGMTKTQVNGIALIIQIRVVTSGALDEFGDLIHFVVACRDKTFEAFAFINESRLSLSVHEIYDFSKNGISRTKQVAVIARTALVPIAEGFPFVSVPPRTKDISLRCENEVGPNRKREIGQA